MGSTVTRNDGSSYLRRTDRPADFFFMVGLIVLLVVLGGRPAHATDRQLPWNAQDCDFAIVLVPTSIDRIQPHVPEGFTPTVPEEAAELLPPDPRMEAVFGYEVLHCAEQTIGEHQTNEIAYASLWTFVEPSPDVADPDFPLAFVKWITLVPDPQQRADLEALGVPVTSGSADLSGLVVTAAGAAYDATFSLGPEKISYRTSGVSNNPTTFQGRFIEYSPLIDRPGLARWRTHFAADQAFGGTAVVRWDQDAMATEVLGTTEAQAWVLAGSGLTFADGSITVPAQAPAPSNQHQDGPRPGQDAIPAGENGELPASGGGTAVLGVLLLAGAVVANTLVRRHKIPRQRS